MDEYAARVTQPLRAAYSQFRAGEATLLDLSRVASQVAGTVDNAHANLLILLRQADSSLEYGYHATEREEHATLAEGVFGPILAIIDGE